jgi:protein-S-isoprenylcysteine O-methyltransferase Ste14
MLVKLGNWFFQTRNYLFPVFYAALFIPSEPILESQYPLISGSFFIALGILVRCITIGLVYIVRGGNNRKIHAENLVTTGIYSICRNPMYLGNILLIFGFGLFANSLIFTLIFFPLFVFIYIAIMKAEEDFLTNKFGMEFIDFKNRVPALFPKISGITFAFKGFSINWKKIIIKEYNSLYLYIAGLLILLFVQNNLELDMFILVTSVLTFFYLLVKYLKKREIINV